MKVNFKLWALLPIFMALLVFLQACQKDFSLQPPSKSTELSKNTALEYRILNWKSESTKVLSKRLVQRKMIVARKGGRVGGHKTLGNSVYIPPGALDKNTFITLKVSKNLAEIVLFPDLTFNKPVAITMSWKHLDLDEESPMVNG
ncbi:MAG: hypothetical protein ACE5QV_09860 [Fidelibacterota bacterium]